MATLWIHRASAADILVRFVCSFDAYNFALKFMKDKNEICINPLVDNYRDPGNCIEVAKSPTLQLSIHPGNFHHSGWMNQIGWSMDGTMLVSQKEAMELGENGVAYGFIPGESQEGLWVSNKVK
jgi:hypothetical protein